MAGIKAYENALAAAKARLDALLRSGAGSASLLATARRSQEIMAAELKSPKSVLVYDSLPGDKATSFKGADHWRLACERKAADEINPQYLIISAPKQEDSPHDHPHDDAMELYRKHVEEDGIFHLGSGPYSVIVDIDSNGGIDVKTDTELIDEYSDPTDDEGDDKNEAAKVTGPAIVVKTTRLDDKPMG